MRAPARLAIWLLLATAARPSIRGEAVGFFPENEAVAGTQAVAKTVFRGEQIEEFPLEIIGRFRNFAGPGQDVILARLLGERTAFTGVVGGMSGSPVYVDGRLLGAISYRLGTFAKEPIAGITPIQEMIRAGEFPVGAAAAWRNERSLSADATGLVPIETPLLLGGFRRDVIQAFAPRLEALGLQPVQSGIAEGTGSGAYMIQPGASIAAVLVQGDLSVAATGTITHVSGKRLYAFGHPFLQAGTVEIPAARATILWTLSSWQGSNKVAAIGEAVGTIHEDRLTAVVGELGSIPRMIPVTVEMNSGGPSPHRLKFELARARNLVPLLINLTVANSLMNTLEFSDEATLFVSGSIEVPGHAPIRVEDAFAGDGSSPAGLAAASRIAQTVAAIYDNPFREADIEAVTVRVEQVPRIQASTIDRVVLPSDEIHPGSPFEIRLHLRNYRNEPSTESATVTLPADTLPGPAILTVGEGRALESVSPLFSIQGRLASARDYGSYLDRLSEEPKGGCLYLRLVRPTRGAVLRSEMLPDLPPSILALLSARRAGERPPVVPGVVIWERVLELPRPASGVRVYPLTIGRVAPEKEPKEGL